jgi:6-phosphogluconolactonase
MSDSVRWHCLSDADAVAEQALARIVSASQRAIAERGRFSIVLAGGTTPERVYRRLKDCDSDWSRWHVWFGDERCLPADHPERNSVMAQRAWLAHVPIPAEQIHPIPAELGPQQAAETYQSLIRSGIPFDLVLLGIGEDGHTASLFPGHAHPDGRLVVPVFNAPKPPPERVSLTVTALSDTRELCVLVTGESKRKAVQQWRQGADLPIARLRCAAGIDVLLDEAVCEGVIPVEG